MPAVCFGLSSLWHRAFVGAVDERLQLLLCVAGDVGGSWVVSRAGYNNFFHDNDMRFVPSTRQAVWNEEVLF